MTMLRVAAAMLLMALPAAAEAADGPALYKRCAACHLATGAGVTKIRLWVARSIESDHASAELHFLCAC